MTISEKGLAFIRGFEGLVLKAYPDPATGGEPITIGYGSTKYEDGTKVKLGDVITKERAEKMLRKDILSRTNALNTIVKATVNQNQFDALASLIYNIGGGNFNQSTLLKKVNKDPNDISISTEFMKWNRAAGKEMAGLTRRRAEEAKMYFS